MYNINNFLTDIYGESTIKNLDNKKKEELLKQTAITHNGYLSGLSYIMSFSTEKKGADGFKLNMTIAVYNIPKLYASDIKKKIYLDKLFLGIKTGAIQPIIRNQKNAKSVLNLFNSHFNQVTKRYEFSFIDLLTFIERNTKVSDNSLKREKTQIINFIFSLPFNKKSRDELEKMDLDSLRKLKEKIQTILADMQIEI